MLFVVDRSLDEVVRSQDHPDYDVACSELDRLARARWMRRLVIFAESRELIDIVETNPRLSLRSKAVFAHVHRSRAFKGELLRRLPVRVRITAGRADPALVDRAGVREIVISVARVPHGFFDFSILLAENLTDARCYLMFARAATVGRAFGLPSISIAAEPRGGGGSATEAEYLRLKLAAERLALCALDSDLRSPTKLPSAWRKRIVQSDVDAPCAITSSIVIEAYSIENLIGVDAILQTGWVKSDPARAYAIASDAVAWRKHSALPHWRYIALKKGVTCAELRNGRHSDPYWVKNAVHFVDYSSKACGNDLSSCRRSCDRIPKYAESCAVEFVNHFDAAEDAALSVVVSSVAASMRAEFERLVREIVGWCCVGGDTGVAGAG